MLQKDWLGFVSKPSFCFFKRPAMPKKSCPLALIAVESPKRAGIFAGSRTCNGKQEGTMLSEMDDCAPDYFYFKG
jgi:hypothetical protein